ncbi:unnamed protein product [Pieris brassicae]|uniref:Uncharacterized protein n=1 Tax=Pieris brassicae TaxID=7116 RepID=A0A9P0TWB4_PIEBR|nr:unnamed protein product [Pieris brassicae]
MKKKLHRKRNNMQEHGMGSYLSNQPSGDIRRGTRQRLRESARSYTSILFISLMDIARSHWYQRTGREAAKVPIYSKNGHAVETGRHFSRPSPPIRKSNTPRRRRADVDGRPSRRSRPTRPVRPEPHAALRCRLRRPSAILTRLPLTAKTQITLRYSSPTRFLHLINLLQFRNRIIRIKHDRLRTDGVRRPLTEWQFWLSRLAPSLKAWIAAKVTAKARALARTVLRIRT